MEARQVFEHYDQALGSNKSKLDVQDSLEQIFERNSLPTVDDGSSIPTLPVAQSDVFFDQLDQELQKESSHDEQVLDFEQLQKEYSRDEQILEQRDVFFDQLDQELPNILASNQQSLLEYVEQGFGIEQGREESPFVTPSTVKELVVPSVAEQLVKNPKRKKRLSRKKRAQLTREMWASRRQKLSPIPEEKTESPLITQSRLLKFGDKVVSNNLSCVLCLKPVLPAYSVQTFDFNFVQTVDYLGFLYCILESILKWEDKEIFFAGKSDIILA